MDPSEIFILTPLYLVKFHAMLNWPNCFNSYGSQKFTLPFKTIKKFPGIECVCVLSHVWFFVKAWMFPCSAGIKHTSIHHTTKQIGSLMSVVCHYYLSGCFINRFGFIWIDTRKVLCTMLPFHIIFYWSNLANMCLVYLLSPRWDTTGYK